MEVKRDLNVDCSEDFENMSEAAILLQTKANSADGKTVSLVKSKDPRKHAISTRKKQSLDLKEESPARGKAIRKTRSLSAQFLINIDELINNVTTGSYDEKGQGAVLSRASSNELGSFPLAGSALPSDNISDAKTLQNPYRSKN